MEGQAKTQEESAPDKSSQVTAAPSDAQAINPAYAEKDKVPEKPTQNATGFVTKADEGFYKHFLTPGLSELEAVVAKNTAFLDDINKKMEDERKAKRKEERTKHIPGPLKGDGQTKEDIMKKLNDLIEYENYDENLQDNTKLVKAKLRDLGDNEHIALLAHSVAAYVSILEPSHLKNLSTRIMSDCNLWLSRLFRFVDSSASFHDDPRDGIVKLCRLTMYQKYPKYSTEGYMALYTKPPVIYLSAAAKPGLIEYLCSQLGVPESCICIVPCNTVFGSQHKIDIATFERLVAEDVESQKTPLLLVAYAGTPAIGHVDNLQRLGEICKKHNIWLHVEGNHLATLATFAVPTAVQPAKAGDSMTLHLSSWLGLPGVPFVTLYKTTDVDLAQIAGLTSNNTSYKLSCVPVWVCLQNMGHDGVLGRIKHSLNLAKSLSEGLRKFPTVKQLNRSGKTETQKTENEQIKGLGDLFNRAVSALVIFDIATPTVVFRYGLSKDKPGKEVAPYAKTESAENVVDQELSSIDSDYYDALNIWLAETMKREIPRVHLEILQLDSDGVSIRIAPLESAQIQGTTVDDVKNFLESLQEQFEILDATVNQRNHFREVVLAQDNLRLLEMPHWAGLGVVQYIPKEWLAQVDNLPPHGVKDVNNLNAEMVHQLKNNDTAFSLGRTENGMNCVRFGLITDDTDIEELIGLVYTVGKTVEESSRFLEKMAEHVKRGIEAANKDLEKENEEKLMQEGVLRQVPLVGSLLNWWSPPPKEGGIRGRTFNLTSGAVKSTEETYKYHMQIQENKDNKSTQEHMPFKASLKSPRSKTEAVATVNGTSHSPKSSDASNVTNESTTKQDHDTVAPPGGDTDTKAETSAADVVQNLKKNVETVVNAPAMTNPSATSPDVESVDLK